MDKYDVAIAVLEANPSQIHEAWENTGEHDAGCLFQFASRNNRYRDDDGKTYGCPTMIRGRSEYSAQTPELTAAIRADERIPTMSEDITVDTLPVFAEWQRRLDKELKRA